MPITDTLKGEAWQPASRMPLVLLEITQADLSAPVRVVNDRIPITHNGDEYIAFPFDITLPDDQTDTPPRARLRIDNVSREIGQAIRLMTTAALVHIRVVRRPAPDVVEMEFPNMVLTNVMVDALTVEGELHFEDLSREPFPVMTFSPAEFPGLVR